MMMFRLMIFMLPLFGTYLCGQDFKRAPNAYIYDVDYAEINGFGGLKIPVKKAYEAWRDPTGFLKQNIPNGKQTAFVYWEDVPGLIRSVSMEGEGENANIRVAVNPGKGKGNAVVSFHVGNQQNGQDPIFWSWHIWVTDDPTQGVEYSKGFETNQLNERFDPIHMDRNLGAVNAHFLGHDWHKSSGLFYEWGRKDPFPPLLHKDRSYYELNGLVGAVTDEDVSLSGGLHYKMTIRPFAEVAKNIQYAVQHPLEYLINGNTGTWFAEKHHPNETPDIAWDLWSDNFGNANSNANSSNPEVSADSKSYELKSVYDPCPGGWRVVSNYGRVASNNNLSPYGRGGGGNDDIYNAYGEQGFYLDPEINDGKPSSHILAYAENPTFKGLKIYPKLGFDFRAVEGRNLGLIPIGGRFQLYKKNGEFTHAIYQDELADGAFWSATYGSSHPRFSYYIADADQPDHGIGRFRFRINDIGHSSTGHNVRCIQDPNDAFIGSFGTNYIQTPQYQVYTKGLTDPNSYLIEGNQQFLEIPVNKAFSVHNQILSEQGEMLPSNDLKANVLWTTNKALIKNISIISAADAKDSKIKVEFNPGEKGNAVVSLHNEHLQNPAYWSWHIWVPNSEVASIDYTTEDIIPSAYHIINATQSKYPPLTTEFMDRNLGALESFPTVSSPDSPNSNEIEQIKKSGGFHYQWGRKDPIPSFQWVGSADTYEIYRGIAVNNAGEVTYQDLNGNDYDSFYTESYANYSNAAGIQSSDNKHVQAVQILKYAIQHPMTFLYHAGIGTTYTAPNAINTAQMRDWLSNSVGQNGDRSLHADRWGHASKKSVFDPCPEGWRVPDVSVVLLRTSGKGTSPWYFGRNGSNGIDQRDYYNVVGSYGGKDVKINGQRVGWMFQQATFNIGNFPKTGIRGELGEMHLSQTTGVWTAALSDYMTGYALGLQLNKDNYLRTTTGVYPQAGMNVRCAKDGPRYVADQTLSTEEFEITEGENLMVYPNPVSDWLNIQSNQEFDYVIYDAIGQKLTEGRTKNQQLSFQEFSKGIYFLVLNQSITKKIIKK